jgi:hypothetical protein
MEKLRKVIGKGCASRTYYSDPGSIQGPNSSARWLLEHHELVAKPPWHHEFVRLRAVPGLAEIQQVDPMHRAQGDKLIRFGPYQFQAVRKRGATALRLEAEGFPAGETRGRPDFSSYQYFNYM